MPKAYVYRGSPEGRAVRHEAADTTEPLTSKQILVRITHSGICGTDEHYKTQDIVLGHEGVGIVECAGSSVKSLKRGDRVGWGYCHGSCMACSECARGQQLYCDSRQLYGSTNLDQGSLASHAVWEAEEFLFSIPASMSSAAAAPLMCAGAAVYSALNAVQVRWSDRVGVVGIGVLGHLAIQFAAKMGCHVVAYSHSPNKQADAVAFGAAEFQCLSSWDGKKMTGDPGPVDHLLLAVSQQPDWGKIIPLVRRGGTIVAMTVDPDELRVPYMELVMNAISIRGSLPAPPRLHQEMLQFAAFQRVLPTVQTFPFTEDGINEAMDKLRKGKIRYRAVVAQE
ncbi:hypothetical protein NW762_006225 [Fusarium torreyae]|uniref:Enoyl reductase (ER) domain-containing protein n=1 Tax=Fusarium torreyae TaxID=1237075 RepID=A0A9W8VFD5_9HYPO|nr:hypothetical protein NW762_006225 [Fusarium torreyae]